VSTESVRELGIEVGSIAMAQIKATNVSLQVPNGGNL
ncbi:MAG: MerR family transcriptional regulator, partial [Actinomyces sp.]|nr:MerR family transcriptional regulator [Actinomyces sp.]